MDVDTGSRVLSSERSDSPLSSFSKDLQNGLPPSQAPCCSFLGAESRSSLQPEDRKSLLSQIAK
ncbi:hypothetical protein JRQ81_017886, partial [Phrynocephalus forsythii]